jgi:putative hydrolase of the HAD superfamily
MIKAILFDLDGVLTLDKSGTVSTCRYISANTGLDYDTLLVANQKYNQDLLSGKVAYADIWEDFCKDMKYGIDFELLDKAFTSTPIDKKMELLVRELKKHYKIGLITDNKVERTDAIIDTNKWRGLFDVVCVSANLECGKGDEKIFKIATETLGVAPSECVFIDNQDKNLIAPRNIGMRTILFSDEDRNYELIENLVKQ